jgi:CHAD domain-containing protein
MKRRVIKSQNQRDAGLIDFVTEQKEGLCKLMKKTGSKKTSAEHVHDIRVAVRRLRVALWLAKRESETPRFRSLSGALRDTGKVLGKLRQLDVAIGDAKSYLLPVSDLKVRQKKVRHEVARALTPQLGDFLEKELGRFLSHLRRQGGTKGRKGASELHDLAHAQRGRVPVAKEEFHQFRIFIKKVRYAIEAFGYPPGPVKVLHDRLGKAHDLEVLQQLVGKNNAIKRDEDRYLRRAAKLAKPVLRFACERLVAAAERLP